MQQLGSLKVLITFFLFFLSTVIFADDKNYSVLSSDGVKIAIQEKGNPQGQPLIFIHGLLGSHLNWEKQMNDHMLKKYRLITFDLRGHGVSDKPDNEKSYLDGQLWADDLNAVIQKSRAERPILVGWSLGGAVITNYLAKYSDRDIRGAVYVGGVVELTAEQIPAHPNVYHDMTAEDLKTHLDGENAFLRLCFYTQPDIATFERLISAAALANFTMQKAVPNMSIQLEQGLKNTRVPILFINGQYDALVNHETSVKRAFSINPKIKFEIFKNSGHAPFYEESDLFNQTLDRFVKKS
ncbi:alpha/beta hydrolase [Acinetobacter sichuanensis]|uniref:alpha/beta fold hydrolase n=1 Tax=Acinetobacter sichuanensis TaxID=2136183 RepID=UPI00280CA467|nr:alpha/beta hydrolase [Acinetobacter sichuanensis]MDQ9021861.1 alpha/beta hydrolase [Acinetobacter sichuanensis]